MIVGSLLKPKTDLKGEQHNAESLVLVGSNCCLCRLVFDDHGLCRHQGRQGHQEHACTSRGNREKKKLRNCKQRSKLLEASSYARLHQCQPCH